MIGAAEWNGECTAVKQKRINGSVGSPIQKSVQLYFGIG